MKIFLFSLALTAAASSARADVLVHCFDVNSPADGGPLVHEVTVSREPTADGGSSIIVDDRSFATKAAAYQPQFNAEFIAATLFLDQPHTLPIPFPVAVELTVDLRSGPVLGDLYGGTRYVRNYPDIDSETARLYCRVTRPE